MTFIEALNNPETRSLIELIEEAAGNPDLIMETESWVEQLAALGYDYNSND